MAFDKSHLSQEIQEKQKIKGTYDSPCMSICNYDEESTICQTCGIKREEKQTWKVADATGKQLILKALEERQLKS